MSHILAIGVATLDMISTVDGYPAENAEIRATSRQVTPGGNAANSARALVRLGHRVDLAAVLARDPDGKHLAEMLRSRGVGVDHCVWRHGRTPCSHVTLNTRTGSRTIVHFRDLPEFQATDLAAAPVEQVDWVHLEARDGAATARMLVALRARLVDQPVSLEVEKDRPGVDELLPRPDVLLCSRPFARGRGFDSAPGFLEYMGRIARRQILVCTWGEAGAWARDPAGALYHAPAMSPSRIVDTLGAGDTFNAGFIHAMASGRNVPEALDLAVQLAGHKVGQYGLDGPGEVT